MASLPDCPDNVDVSKLAFQTPFWQAFYERNFTTGTLPAAGANVQSLTTNAPASSIGIFSIRRLQTAIGLASSYVDHTIDILADLNTQAATSLGVTPVPKLFSDTGNFNSVAGLNAAGYRRKRPREVAVGPGGSTVSSRNDVWGNAPSTGNVAIGLRSIANTSDVTGSPASGDKAILNSALGTVYQYNPGASPKWQPLTARREQWTVSVKNAPTSGTFTLTFRGATTSALPYNATASQVTTALAALSTMTGLSPSGAGTAVNVGAGVLVTFGGTEGFVPPPMASVSSNTMNNNGYVRIVRSQNGATAYMPNVMGMYRYDGTQWVRVSRATADVLDSNSGTMPYGFAAVGDLLGGWLYREVKQVLLALKWTRVGTITVMPGGQAKSATGTAAGGSVGTAQSRCDAAWATGTAVPGESTYFFGASTALPQANSFLNDRSGTTNSSAQLQVAGGSNLRYRTPFTATIPWRARGYLQIAASGTFDANGTSWVEGFNDLGVTAYSTSEKFFATTFASVTPAWGPLPAAFSTSSRGFIDGYTAGYIEWQFAYDS